MQQGKRNKTFFHKATARHAVLTWPYLGRARGLKVSALARSARLVCGAE